MRNALPVLACLAASLTLAACGTMRYEDTNAAVDARPECASAPSQPNEPVASWCERTQSASWSSERDSEPVDFGGKDDDDS